MSKLAYVVEVDTRLDEDDYEFSIEEMHHILGEWVEANGSDATDYVLIEGKGMTWQRLSGSAVVDFDKFYESLQFGNDFRLTLKLEGKKLTGARYSHDEPMGATFEFSFSPEVSDFNDYR